MPITYIKPLYNKSGKLRGYIDKYTGKEYSFPVILMDKRNPYQKGWFMNNQETSILLAKDKEIKGQTHRILRFIEGILNFENWLYISVTEIARELDIHRQDVSKGIKLLQEKEIILKGPKIGKCYTYMLNPSYGWKGKVKNLEKYREEKEKEKIEELKNKVDKQNDGMLKMFSEKYNISIDKVEKFLKENTEVK